MQTETTQQWLASLASGNATPGGGAAAAMNAAIGAALVSMVCNLTTGRAAYAEHEDNTLAVLDRAEKLRAAAVRLADDDAVAFEAVMAAYRLPKATESEKTARSAAIQQAQVQAAAVPRQVADVAVEVIELAHRLVDRSNTNVLSDVAVAASSARAALEAAIVNIEVNVGAIDEPTAASTADAVRAADTIVALVRERIAK
jgi:formiminotetrahydrofolate cyclodeaminase